MLFSDTVDDSLEYSRWYYMHMYIPSKLIWFSINLPAARVCYPLQVNSDRDVQFKDSSCWGHRQAITASTMLPLLSVAADRRRNGISKTSRTDALKRSLCKNNFLSHDKLETRKCAKNTAGKCVCLKDQHTRGAFILTDASSSTQLACLCSCCRYLGYFCASSRARSIIIDVNLEGINANTQDLSLIQVSQELTLTDGRKKNPTNVGTKGNCIQKPSLTNIIP